MPLIDELKLRKKPRLDDVTTSDHYAGVVKGCEISVVTNGKCPRFGVDNVSDISISLYDLQTIFLIVRNAFDRLFASVWFVTDHRLELLQQQ